MWNKYCNKVVADGGKNVELPKDEDISLKSMEMHVGLSLSLSLSPPPPTVVERILSVTSSLCRFLLDFGKVIIILNLFLSSFINC